MPIVASRLQAHVEDDVSVEVEVRLHTGDPGSSGTANEVALSSLTIPVWPVIAAGHTTSGGWVGAAVTNGYGVTKRDAASGPDSMDDLSFGNASSAISGVSWVSYWRGASGSRVYFAKRQLASGADIADGAPISLTRTTIRIEYTSTD